MFNFFRKSKNQQRHDTLEKNKENGKIAENMYRTEADLNGVQYRRTGKGHDFEEKRYDYTTGKTQKIKVEVKSNNASLSKLQKKTRKKNQKNYEVRRYDTSIFGFGGIIDEPEHKKKKRSNSQKSNYGFTMDDVFGSGKNNSEGWF